MESKDSKSNGNGYTYSLWISYCLTICAHAHPIFLLPVATELCRPYITMTSCQRSFGVDWLPFSMALVKLDGPHKAYKISYKMYYYGRGRGDVSITLSILQQILHDKYISPCKKWTIVCFRLVTINVKFLKSKLGNVNLFVSHVICEHFPSCFAYV